MNLRSVTKSLARMALFCAIPVMGLSSCNSIFTDQSHCPKGLALSFRYEYNMEYVNSFHKKGDCLSLFVFDDSGRLVGRYDETGEALRSEDYEMNLSLDEGRYTLLAYGGIACENASFELSGFPSKALLPSVADLRLSLKGNVHESSSSLHPLFYGLNYVEVTGKEDFIRDTVQMVKNTNNFRIILQQASGKPLYSKDFVISISDDNALLDGLNEPLRNGGINYAPWTSGEKLIGGSEEDETAVSVAYAELSTSRLTIGTGARLKIARADNGETILNIPLSEYLLLLRSDLYAEMKAQEFLDRESEWSMIFFLDDGLRWINTRIVINDWVVRINNTDL